MIFEQAEIAKRKAMIEEMTGVKIPGEIRAAQEAGLQVDWDGGDACIAAEDTTALCRGLFLLSRAIREKQGSLHLREERHFAHCGAMLDMSRNQVMTVAAVKEWMDRQAALGLNMLMLYTEDTYEIPEYPYFGYLRGRYTREDLQELDRYAATLGIEMIPCVQTLAHMAQYLQWPAARAIKDQPDILLIDSEETYTFLDTMIRTLASCFTSRRILIGMDEAHGVGLGQYLLRHGYTDRFDLMNRHLERVCGICRKYGFRPIMWSDMFFRLGSKKNDYYDPESHVPDRVIEQLPQVEMAYWDYYHDSEAFYEHMLREHERMGRGTVYAGGVWCWSGFMPNRQLTRHTMDPALRVNARRRTDTVIATFWGDDGAETSYRMGIDGLTLFSEACWRGPEFDPAECDRMAECLTGVPTEIREAWDAFYADDYLKRSSKRLLWSDPLYPCGVDGERMETLHRAAGKAIRTLETAAENTENRYALALFRTLQEKIELRTALRKAYEAGNREAVRQIAETDLPAVTALYETLNAAHRALWEASSRRQGWEVLSLRYGGAIGRLEDVRDELERWIRGEISSIPELDEAELPDGKGDLYNQIVTPSANVW